MSMTQADMAKYEEPVGVEAGAEPTAEDAMNAMEDERIAQLDAIAASAPEPEKPFSTSLVSKLADALNSLMVMVEDSIAQIEYAPEGAREDGPLPSEVYVPLVLTLMYVSQLGGYEKYEMNPEDLINDAAVRKAIALVQMMQKDDALIEDLKQPAPGEEDEMEDEMEDELPESDELPAEPLPGEYDEEDEALMAEM